TARIVDVDGVESKCERDRAGDALRDRRVTIRTLEDVELARLDRAVEGFETLSVDCLQAWAPRLVRLRQKLVLLRERIADEKIARHLEARDLGVSRDAVDLLPEEP